MPGGKGLPMGKGTAAPWSLQVTPEADSLSQWPWSLGLLELWLLLMRGRPTGTAPIPEGRPTTAPLRARRGRYHPGGAQEGCMPPPSRQHPWHRVVLVHSQTQSRGTLPPGTPPAVPSWVLHTNPAPQFPLGLQTQREALCPRYPHFTDGHREGQALAQDHIASSRHKDTRW